MSENREQPPGNPEKEFARTIVWLLVAFASSFLVLQTKFQLPLELTIILSAAIRFLAAFKLLRRFQDLAVRIILSLVLGTTFFVLNALATILSGCC